LYAVKGFAWAALLYALLRQSDLPVSQQLRGYFVPGMVGGLALGLLVVLRERLVYPGLFDFDSAYRIAGAFADMHVGGPSVETWLVMATPFVLLWAWQRRSAWGLLPALALFLLALYALAVSYSRGGYFGMALALVIAMLGLLAAWRGAPPLRRRRLAVLLLLPLGAAAGIAAQVGGGFAGQRVAQIEEDMEQRLANWQEALELARADGGVNAFGNGPGSFPRLYLTGNRQGHVPANFTLVETPEDNRLRIGAGDSFYFNQRVALPRAGAYRVEMRVRAAGTAAVAIFVCEKYVRYSFDCEAERFVIAGSDEWTELRWEFEWEDFASRPAPLQRGLALSIAHYGGSGVLEIDHIGLKDAGGTEYLENGGFDDGLHHWYMSSDDLDSWRIENQWVEIWFDQGWFGLAAFVALVLGALCYLGVAAVRGSVDDALMLAALAGVLAVGVFSTVFWSPRLAMLFFLVLLLALASRREAATAGA
jgi:O-antigen ligase